MGFPRLFQRPADVASFSVKHCSGLLALLSSLPLAQQSLTGPSTRGWIMAQYRESERVSLRGHKLFTVEYYPEDASNLRAALVFHHGLAEHVGRYKQSEFTCLCQQ